MKTRPEINKSAIQKGLECALRANNLDSERQPRINAPTNSACAGIEKRASLLAILTVITAISLSFQQIAIAAENKDGKEEDKKNFLKTNFEKLRDPFWPVGWRPEPEVPEEEKQPKRKIEWPKLRLKGTTDKFAIIEGFGVVEEGKEISAIRKGVQYTWKIDEVSKDKVDIRQLRAVPLR